MIQAAFFDIDGTLLSASTGHLIPPSTKRALAELRRRGVRLFIASGRARPQLPPCISEGFPGLEGGFDAYVTMTGSRCYDAQGIYDEVPVDPQIARRVVSLVDAGRFDALALMGDRVFCNRRSGRVRELEGMVGDTYEVGDLHDALASPVFQFCAFVPPEDDAWLREELPGCIVTRWCDVFCDIVPAESSKPHGIRATLAHFGLEGAETIAFGDGGNDATMLECCTIGVAMGNGTAEAKAAADYVTDAVDREGIPKALRHFGLID